MADTIISGQLSITNRNYLTVTVNFEYTSTGSFGVRVILSEYSDYSSGIYLHNTSRQNMGNSQWKYTFEEGNLDYNKTYYVKIELYDQNGNVVDTHVGNITTLSPPPRLSLTLSIYDKNNIRIIVGVDVLSGDPSMIPEVHFALNQNASRNDPQPVFVSQSSTGNHYEYTYQAETLKYDSLYSVGVWLVEYADPTNVIETADDWILTDQDGSIIISVTTKPKQHRCVVTARIKFETGDSYLITIDYGTTTNYGTNKIYDSSTQISTRLYDFVFNLTRLQSNTKYYFRINLINQTTGQLIDTETGDFTTLKDDNPWWMYLRYTL